METGAENHQVGTCRMGPATSPESVVDSNLQVHKVHNLRVVDASIMPIITNANTMGPVIMIAEKAADMINDKYSAQMMPKLFKPAYLFNWKNSQIGCSTRKEISTNRNNFV